MTHEEAIAIAQFIVRHEPVTVAEQRMPTQEFWDEMADDFLRQVNSSGMADSHKTEMKNIIESTKK